MVRTKKKEEVSSSRVDIRNKMHFYIANIARVASQVVRLSCHKPNTDAGQVVNVCL